MELEESIKLAVEGCGLDLYDIVTTKEHKTNILRVLVTSKNGVNLDQCAHASRMISPLLDIHSPIHGKYNLEVSSPGIERKLISLHHFQCSIGDKVKIKEFSGEKIKGKITEVSEDGTIKVVDLDDAEHTLKLDEISSAATYFEW